jgi:hypothetical protein
MTTTSTAQDCAACHAGHVIAFGFIPVRSLEPGMKRLGHVITGVRFSASGKTAYVTYAGEHAGGFAGSTERIPADCNATGYHCAEGCMEGPLWDRTRQAPLTGRSYLEGCMLHRAKMLILASMIALTATVGVVAAVTQATASAVPVAEFGGPGQGPYAPPPGTGCTTNGGAGVIHAGDGGLLCQ